MEYNNANGDFEIVEKIPTESPNSVSLLSNIPPPSELPSFITAQPIPPAAGSQSSTPTVSQTSNVSQPPHAPIQPVTIECNDGKPQPIPVNPTPSVPVTIQPLPPNTRGHLRNHSYPLSVNSSQSANVLLNPPPPSTPPCLIIQQPLYVKPVENSPVINTLGIFSEKPHPFNSTNKPRPNFNISFVSDPSSACYSSASESPSTSSLPTAQKDSLEGDASPPGEGWMGWIKGTVQSVGHKVAEKAKTSMDTMITTLDPQMRELINSGGDVDIIVASDKEVKVSPVKEAFQKTFGKATVTGFPSQCSNVAAQPVGYSAAEKSAEERIQNLRKSGKIHPEHPVVAVENFVIELKENYWVEMGLLLLDDPWFKISLSTYTQPIPLPDNFIQELRKSTPDDYPLKATGFQKTIGQVAAVHLMVHHSMWQETLTGIPRRDYILMAAKVLAELYRARLPNDVI